MKKILLYILSLLGIFLFSCTTTGLASKNILEQNKESLKSQIDLQSFDDYIVYKNNGFDNPFYCSALSKTCMLGTFIKNKEDNSDLIVCLFMENKNNAVLFDTLEFHNIKINQIKNFYSEEKNLLFLSFFKDKRKENILITQDNQKLKTVLNFPSALNQKLLVGDFLENGLSQIVVLFSKTELASVHDETIVNLYEFKNGSLVKTQGFGLVTSLQEFLHTITELIEVADYKELSSHCDKNVDGLEDFLTKYAVYRESFGDVRGEIASVSFHPIAENPFDIYSSKNRAEILFKIGYHQQVGKTIFSIPVKLKRQMFVENKFVISH